MGRLGDTQANASIDTVTALIATVGLSQTEPALDGTGITEPVGNGYARAAATSWTAASNRVAWNSAAVVMATPTGSGWGSCTHYVFFDGSGNYLAHERLAIPQTILAGAYVYFAVGALKFRAPTNLLT